MGFFNRVNDFIGNDILGVDESIANFRGSQLGQGLSNTLGGIPNVGSGAIKDKAQGFLAGFGGGGNKGKLPIGFSLDGGSNAQNSTIVIVGVVLSGVALAVGIWSALNNKPRRRR